MKVALCGEEKAARPIKVSDAREGLDLEFCQIVPGSKDREGRHVSRWEEVILPYAVWYGTAVLHLISSRPPSRGLWVLVCRGSSGCLLFSFFQCFCLSILPVFVWLLLFSLYFYVAAQVSLDAFFAKKEAGNFQFFIRRE